MKKSVSKRQKSSFKDFKVTKLHGLLVHDEIMREFFSRLITLHNSKYPKQQLTSLDLDIYIRDSILDFSYQDFKTQSPIQNYIKVQPKYKTKSMNPDILIIVDHANASKLFGVSLAYEVSEYMKELLFAIFNKILYKYFKNFINKEVEEYLTILANSSYVSGLEASCILASKTLNHFCIYKHLSNISFRKGHMLPYRNNFKKQSIRFTINTLLAQLPPEEISNFWKDNDNIEDCIHPNTIDNSEDEEILTNLYTQNFYLTFQQNPEDIETTRIILSIYGIKSSNNIISDVYSINPSANTLDAYLRELDWMLAPDAINPLMGIYRHVLSVFFMCMRNTTIKHDNKITKDIKGKMFSLQAISFLSSKLKHKNYKHNKITLIKEYCLALYIIASQDNKPLTILSDRIRKRIIAIIAFLHKIKDIDINEVLLDEIKLLPLRNK